MPVDEDGLSDDFAGIVGEDSILGDSILSESHARASNKVTSKAPSKPSSKAASELGADDSFFALGSPQPSHKASKAASAALTDDSFARSNDSLRHPTPKANPLLSAGGGSATRPSSARPSTASSRGRPASPFGATPSDDFADLLGSGSADRSSASLPRGQPSTAGSSFGAAVNAAAAARPPSSSHRPPSQQSSAPLSSNSPTPRTVSRPESLHGNGFGANSLGGSSTPGATLGPPEASPSPRVSRSPFTAQHAAGATAGGGGSGGGAGNSDARQRPLLQADKGRTSQMECHIPTPFELFRLYDTDLNGRVTHEEFISMMRDLDGHPLHYAPQDDPEHRLVGLREKRQRRESERAARQEQLSLAEMHRQASEDQKKEIAAEVEQLAAEVSELDALIAEEEVAVRGLVNHPEESQRVTPEVRQHRAQWRSWVQEEFKRADLGGNGVLSIDEFYMYYYSKMCFRFPVMRTGVNPGALLFNVFVRYCSIGRGAVGGRNEDMLSHQFSKLCRDAGLINGKTITKAAVDIVYHRARAADESLETYQYRAGVAATARMYYPQFLFALDKIAEKRRSGFQEVVARVLSSIDTLPEPTFADFLIIRGDQLEAGAQVPEFLTRHKLLPDNSRELRALADNDLIRKMKEESKDALRLSMGIAPKPESADGGLQAFLELKKRADGGAGDGGAGAGAGNGGGAGGGAGAPMAGTTGDALGGGGGECRNASVLQASVYGSLPPPSLVPDMLRQKKWERAEPSDLSQSRAAAAARGVAAVLSPDTMHVVRSMDPDQLMAALKRVYEAYTAWAGGVDRTAMDRRRFSKVLRDALLVSESGPLPTRKAEMVYDKVLPASSRALNFIQFIEALRHVALHHRLSLNEVMEKLVAVGSPRPGP